MDSERSVQIAEFHAQALVKKAKGDAEAKTTTAAADAEVTQVTGNAEAGRIQAVGEAEAAVLQRKIGSVGAEFYAAMDIFGKLAGSNLRLVPEIAMAGAAGGTGGPLEALLALVLRDQAKGALGGNGSASAR